MSREENVLPPAIGTSGTLSWKVSLPLRNTPRNTGRVVSAVVYSVKIGALTGKRVGGVWHIQDHQDAGESSTADNDDSQASADMDVPGGPQPLSEDQRPTTISQPALRTEIADSDAVEKKKTETTSPDSRNPYAIAGLCLGVISIFLGQFGVFPIAAAILSGIGLAKQKHYRSGRGQAIAGLVLGFIYMLVFIRGVAR